MAGQPRRRQDQKSKPEPYATFRPDIALAAAMKLDGGALKLWLLLQAAWKPNRRPGEPGSAFVPYKIAQTRGGQGLKGTTAVAEAFRALVEAGLISLATPATQPGGPGGALGLATEWRLPDRDGEAVGLRLVEGVKAPSGKLRLHNGRIRSDVHGLTPIEIQVLIFLVARLDRDKDGSLVSVEPFCISNDAIAKAIGSSSSAVDRAIDTLQQSGRVTCVEPHRGRRAASRTVAHYYQCHERRSAVTAAGRNAAPESG